MTITTLSYPHKKLQVAHTAKDLIHLLIKQGVEGILNEELKEHLDVEKATHKEGIKGNSRNGTLKKKVRTSLGPIAIRVPRDRKGTFKPLIVRNYMKDITDKDSSLIALYEEGLPQSSLEASSRELYKDLYHKPSSTLIARIGSFFKQWQQRVYDPLYLALSCDSLFYRTADAGESFLKKGYICSGTDSNGSIRPLGLWPVSDHDDHFWKTFFISLRTKGVTDIWVVYKNELTSFQELLSSIFPRTPFQQYVVMLIHEALPSLPKNLHPRFLLKMKSLYCALNKTEVRTAFKQLSRAWGPDSAIDTSHWIERWERVGPFF